MTDILGRIGARYPAQLAQVLAVPGPWHDRDPAMLGNSVTPQRLTQILLDRNMGYLRDWIDLADEAREKDPHLHSQLAIREQSVVDTDVEVLPGEGTNGRAAKRAVAACTTLLDSWKKREGAGWDQWVAEFVEADFYGHGAHEVIWEWDSGEIAPTALEKLDPRRLSYACDPMDPDPWGMRIWDEVSISGRFSRFFGIPISEFPRDKFLVNEPRVRGAQKTREGLFAVVAWYWLFRTWSWRDLMALAEMVGRPPVIAYFAAGGARMGKQNELTGQRNATEREVAAARKAVHGVSGALRAVLPDTIRMEALRYQIPTTNPIQILASREIDSLMSKAINGVDSVSDLKPGARAAVEVQERVTGTFYRASCRRVDRIISSLFARYIRANPQKFGSECPTPTLHSKTDPSPDLVAAGRRISIAQKTGLPVPKQWAHKELGVPEPKAGEPVLRNVLANPDASAADRVQRTPDAEATESASTDSPDSEDSE